MRSVSLCHYIIISLLVLCVPSDTYTQSSKLGRDVVSLSNYIASPHFFEMGKTVDDPARVDSIYLRALQLTDNDISEALLTLVYATIPYNEMPVRLPLIDITVTIPILSASNEVFLAKNANLPSRLFTDTPDHEFGDKDKLAHFFGNAFLDYNSLFFDLSSAIGYFVEAFEKTFKVQSSFDWRDIRANKLGQKFGRDLNDNPALLPSHYIRNQSLQDEHDKHSDH